ncbi:hypothetical protein FOZ60_010211 [Perkinsus olseni]|uniref:Uncharacterized protein n=1 Tax=Perkinsus olseni TaxID=32597 RepID=A0A7J6NFR5_PEROL|nr:hypothetical protein FOZ60_010211 [Perkinsus olseni]
MSEPQPQAVDLCEVPESHDGAPQLLPIRPLTRPSAPRAKSLPPLPKAGPVASVRRGRGGIRGRIRGLPYRYGLSRYGQQLATKAVVAPWAPRPSFGGTDAPSGRRSALCSFPNAPLGPAVPLSSPYRLTKPVPLPPFRPLGASSSTSTVIGVNFQPRYTFDYAHSILKYVDDPSHKARYYWLWAYCYPNSYGPGKVWRERHA